MELDFRNPERVGTQPVTETAVMDTKAAAQALARGEKVPDQMRNSKGEFTTEDQRKALIEAGDQAWLAKTRAEIQANTLPDIKKEQAPEAEAKADAPDAATEAPANDEDKAALAAALLDAKRIGIPSTALEAMSPAELVQSGQVWKKQIAANAEMSRELGELRKKVEATAGGKDAAPSKDGQPALDLDAIVQPFAKAEYDESTRNLLKNFAKDNYTLNQSKIVAVEEAANKRFEELTTRLDRLQQASERAGDEAILDELKGKSPQLGKAVVRNAVTARADALQKAPEYQGDRRLALEHAVRIESASFPAAAQVSEPNRGKRNGVASTTSQAPRTRAQTQEDVDRAAWAKIQASK